MDCSPSRDWTNQIQVLDLNSHSLQCANHTTFLHCRFAVVQQFSTYWADVMSSVVYESGNEEDMHLWLHHITDQCGRRHV